MSVANGLKKVRVAPLAAEPLQAARSIASSLKIKQCEKIAELRKALVQAGFDSLDKQAAALNLSRSTAWIVLRGNYKASGLSGKIVNRMLASPQLPAGVRMRLREYVDEKLAGSFGHPKHCTRRFKMRIGAE